MTYVSDPFDTPEPPCFCGWQGPADQVCTTREFCPACGDPDKPAPEPPADTPDVPEHFIGCHPEHAQGNEKPAGPVGVGPENCWHCGTPTPRGCHCPDCLEGMDYVPPDASYHCPTCGRWWAWMTPVITEITFGDNPQED